MNNKIKILIVDDHKLFRSGLKFILNDTVNMEVIGEASNGKEFLDVLRQTTPDVVLMDINMPFMDGMEASRQALVLQPDLHILVLSMFSDENLYTAMIDIGVKGFVLKDTDAYELTTAVQSVYNGGSYFSQDLLLRLIRKKESNSVIELSPREKDVLNLICKGQQTNQISEGLHISQRTVERHRSSLLLKTDSANSISLVIYAVKNNLVTI
jgi:DNA-binding NarL/FixJ family response regulator